MNSLIFWSGILGSALAFEFTIWALFILVLRCLIAFAIGHALFWFVIYHCGSDKERLFVALRLYVLYALLNTVQCVGAIGLWIFPSFVFMLMTMSTLSCAYYLFRLRELTKDGLFGSDFGSSPLSWEVLEEGTDSSEVGSCT